jgi:hypothetical protein
VLEFWNLPTPSSLVIVSSYIPVQKVWKDLHERGLLMLIFSYGFPKAFKSFLAVLFCSKKVLTCLHQKLCNFLSESLLLSQSSKVPWTKPTVYSFTAYRAYLEKLIHPSQSKPISTFDTDFEYYLESTLRFFFHPLFGFLGFLWVGFLGSFFPKLNLRRKGWDMTQQFLV